MKTVILFYFLTTFLSKAFEALKYEAELKEFYDKKELRIAEATKQPSQEALPILSNLLYHLGSQKSNYLPNSQGARCLALAQNAMLQIPGHAQFIADEYEEYRKTETIWDGGATRAHTLVSQLANLPSPETIKVLGVYLDDFKDTATAHLKIEEQIIENKTLPRGTKTICADLPWLATYAIAEIGLRQPPLGKVELTVYSYQPECTNQWKKTRAWYQEVKAGKRTFSFRGQPVEYRFNADGSWKTMAIANPPDDAIKYPIMTRAEFEERTPKPQAESDTNQSTTQNPHTFWKWLVGIIPLVLVTMWWRISKRRAIE